jgi:hypothetical protein
MRRVTAPPPVEYTRALQRALAALLRAHRAAVVLGRETDAGDLQELRNHVLAIAVAARSSMNTAQLTVPPGQCLTDR